MTETEKTTAESFESKISASVDAILESTETAKPDTKVVTSEKGKLTPIVKAEKVDDDEQDDQKDDITPSTDDNQDDESKDEAQEDEDADEEEDEAFSKAVDKHKIPTTLDDLPEEARPLVAKKLKAMEQGYTRAMQEARSYRTEKATFDAERAYQRDHMDQHMADAIIADPSLVEKVNAEIDRRKDPTYAQAIARDREVTKREAALTAKEAMATSDALDQRGQEIEEYTKSAAKNAGIAFKLVEEAVILAIQGNPKFTEADVDEIIADKVKVLGLHKRAVKGAQTREYARSKADDAKNGGVDRPKASVGLRPSVTKDGAKPKSLGDLAGAYFDHFTTQ